ncbi:hypothetical protein QJS10_CPA10g01357 [Acorus calamus]|uniref:Uncharacterized protein n=1 Tax=Acorus calamus TaxID=4465 RepID=A0AAV9E1Y9_ACOCL|nr:hypothetical protein QJS10_CPA10g01357 [Acorus calamus]
MSHSASNMVIRGSTEASLTASPSNNVEANSQLSAAHPEAFDERSDAMRTVGLTVGGYDHQEVPLEGMHPVMDDLDRTIA